jgi:hypothetical protein
MWLVLLLVVLEIAPPAAGMENDDLLRWKGEPRR